MALTSWQTQNWEPPEGTTQVGRAARPAPHCLGVTLADPVSPEVHAEHIKSEVHFYLLRASTNKEFQASGFSICKTLSSGMVRNASVVEENLVQVRIPALTLQLRPICNPSSRR